ncbi:YdcF family protein [Cycloclasticus pugetii]|uniref:YdcF family protein n=1 Tax=Cycloclasticus pugetii TaxID=34068 RepID=UPI003A93BB9A
MFIFSKLVIAFISPLGTALAMGLIALMLVCVGKKRFAIGTSVIALAWLWAWSLPLSSGWLINKVEADYPSIDIRTLPEVEAVVVLGGGIFPAGASGDYPNLESGADRIWHAARIYHAGKARMVVLSGGRPGDTTDSEAQAMRSFLLDLGVPDEALVLEEKSMNTTENARNTASLLHQRGISEVLLVTSAYHMARSVALFEGEGVRVSPAATDYHSRFLSSWRLWIPDTEALDVSSKAFKELVGRWVGH